MLLLESELGLSPWDVLNQGISEHTPLSFGTANIVVALLVLGVSWLLGAKIGPGTIANAVCIGLFVDGLLAISAIGVLVFAGLTAWDTQKIKSMYDASDDSQSAGRKAVMGALSLYLDFINLFLMLLRLVGDPR